MSNVGYTLTGTPDVLQKTSYKAKVGSNVSYDVLVFGTGHTFTLNGDGGFENVSTSEILRLGNTTDRIEVGFCACLVQTGWKGPYLLSS